MDQDDQNGHVAAPRDVGYIFTDASEVADGYAHDYRTGAMGKLREAWRDCCLQRKKVINIQYIIYPLVI